MANGRPWHSALETDRKVYHDDTRCTEGNNIVTVGSRKPCPLLIWQDS
jgi:hypothetical protein